LFDSIAAQMIPGFEVMKAQTNERFGVEVTNPWQAILFKEENRWCIAFIVEKNTEGMCTLFIPEVPKMDSGEVKIIAEAELHAVPLQAKEAYSYLKKFGSGAGAKLSLVGKEKI